MGKLDLYYCGKQTHAVLLEGFTALIPVPVSCITVVLLEKVATHYFMLMQTGIYCSIVKSFLFCLIRPSILLPLATDLST